MSLSLSRDTDPHDLYVKTWGMLNGKDEVIIGDYSISIEDFFDVVVYVLTNTDLRPDDPRRLFVETVKQMILVKGWNWKDDKRMRLSLNRP